MRSEIGRFFRNASGGGPGTRMMAMAAPMDYSSWKAGAVVVAAHGVEREEVEKGVCDFLAG